MILTFSKRDAYLVPAENTSSVAYIIGGFDRAEEIASAWGSPRASLVFVACEDWNSALSPWYARTCFKGGEDFSGGADEFVNELEGEIMPAVERALNLTNPSRAIIGVSLAGLFALYALYKADAFACAASISGSLWFDGFTDFMASHEMKKAPARVYLSLGDREEFTRNERLRRVGETTRWARDFLEKKGIETTLEMNPGNHFVDGTARMLKALDWLYRA